MPAATDVQQRLRTFFILWFGQLISGIGTGLGSFALGVWVFEKSGSATGFAMVGFVGMSMGLLMTPIAGVVADRFDRKKVLLLSDAAAALGTLTMAYLFYTNQMQIWMVYPIVVWMGGCGVFQGPAMMATVSMLVPREQLTRLSGLGQMVGSVNAIFVPMLSAFLIGQIGYHGVILTDFATFLFAAGTLLAIRLPRTAAMAPGARRGSMFRDALAGWSYIRERNGLFSLLRLFAITNFSIGMVSVLLGPMILSFGDAADLGRVNAAGAAGTMLGALALTLWGGPKVRVWAVFGALVLQGLILQLGGLQPSIPLIAMAAFIFMSTGPFIMGASQAIWQSKVAHEIQGRVLAIRQLVGMSTVPLAYLVAGPLADRVFGPLLLPGGALADSVGRVIGVGPGRGVGLMIMVLGVCVIAAVCIAFLNPRLRNVEKELPDAQQPAFGPGPAAQPAAAPPEAAAIG